MPRRVQDTDSLRARLTEIVGWQTATRNDGKVALELHETRAMDSLYALNEAAFLDELFEYIREIGAWPLLEQLDPDDRRGPSLVSGADHVQLGLQRHDLQPPFPFAESAFSAAHPFGVTRRAPFGCTVGVPSKESVLSEGDHEGTAASSLHGAQFRI